MTLDRSAWRWCRRQSLPSPLAPALTDADWLSAFEADDAAATPSADAEVQITSPDASRSAEASTQPPRHPPVMLEPIRLPPNADGSYVVLRRRVYPNGIEREEADLIRPGESESLPL